MPTPYHRQPVLGPQQLANASSSAGSNGAMGDPLWVVDEAYERPEKESASTITGNVPYRMDTQKHLHIKTYSKADLHDHYMSSEEEPSPSPDSDTERNIDELTRKIPKQMVEAKSEPVIADEYEAEIAIAIPIVAMRPKLVDITNLAPMHKRKRIEKPVLSRSVGKNAALRSPTVTDATKPSVATPKEGLSKRKDSLRPLTPDSWLPNDDVRIVQEEEEEEERDERRLPDLDLRKAPTYDDYDPYSLSPPHLSPRNSYNTTNKRPGSVARARYNSNPPINMNNGWKGLTRSMSLAKRQTHRADRQVSKRPKMIARPANERQEPLKIPAFPVGEGTDIG